MANDIAYARTAKGKAELAEKPGKLPPGLKTLLGLVDNSTVAQLLAKLPKVEPDKLKGALDQLVAQGYIEVAGAAASGAAAEPKGALDFADLLNRPVKVPTIQQLQQAEATLSGLKAAKRPGYFVHIINRAEKRAVPLAGGTQYTVLVIDADENNALTSTRALLLAKFETRAAARQDEIVEQLNKQPAADVIAMDTVLPDVIGLELLGRLREHPVYKSVPIIVMTSKADHDDIVAALAYGASGFMTKPFKPEKLVESVQAVLGL
ncbi:MAG TPA: response regulator [Burkholderiales bacterium]|nr:response regulator [Burkholderiales bacterium]